VVIVSLDILTTKQVLVVLNTHKEDYDIGRHENHEPLNP